MKHQGNGKEKKAFAFLFLLIFFWTHGQWFQVIVHITTKALGYVWTHTCQNNRKQLYTKMITMWEIHAQSTNKCWGQGSGLSLPDIRDRISPLTWVLVQILSIIWSGSEQFLLKVLVFPQTICLRLKLVCTHTCRQKIEKRTQHLLT